MNIWKRNTENDEVRQYLLGNLSDSARERIDRHVLNEAEINEELQATEDELIDQYLSHKLGAREREQFETHFLVTRERQRKLLFGQTLRSYLGSLPVVPHRDSSRSVAAYFSQFKLFVRRPVVIASIIFAVALGVLGVYWLVSHRPGRVTGATLAITLGPGSSRANGEKIKRIEVPASYSSVEVRLEMGTNEYPNYEVELLRERQSLNTYKKLQALQNDGAYVLPLGIPANMLVPGDYTLKLSGVTNSGQTEFREQYLFRVIPVR